MHDLDLTIRYEDTEDGYVVARVAEIPAAVSFGRDRLQAREAVLDALRELALSYLEPPDGPQPPSAEHEVVRIRALSP